MKKTLIGLWLLLAIGLMLTSCTKNDENTIVLIGTEDYIEDFFSMIPDSLEPRFRSEFGDIKGPVPPKIEGSYVLDPKQRISSNVEGWSLQIIEPNVYLRFSGQHNGIVTMDLNEAAETITDTVFIQGKDQDFVVYIIEKLNVEYYSAWMRRAIIMKGRVTDAGLANFRYGTIVLEKEDPANQLAEPGSYYIYKDGNGIADRFDW